MRNKNETHLLLQSFHGYVETQFGRKIKSIRSDNGFEFDMKEFYQNKGIVHETSCIDTPQQNGAVERKHGHLLNVATSLAFPSQLPHSFMG